MFYTKTYILQRYMYGILKNTGENEKAELNKSAQLQV